MRFLLLAPVLASILSFTRAAPSPHGLSTREDSWSFPTEKDIRRPQCDDNAGDSDRVIFTVDVSRCTGGAYRYRPEVQPYDEHSLKTQEGNIHLSVSTKPDEYYVKTIVNLTANGYNGRIFLSDTPDQHDRTGLAGIRIMTDLHNGVTIWPDSDPDEETGQNRTLIAPLSYYYLSTTPTVNKTFITDQKNRGFHFAKTAKYTSDLTGYIQWC